MATTPQAIQGATAPATDITTPDSGTPKATVSVTPKVTPAQIDAAIGSATAIEKSVAVVTDPFAKFADIMRKFTSSSMTRFARLASYMDAMAPGKAVGEIVGGQYQHSLLKVITGIINDPEDFAAAFGVLVQVAKANRSGCFADTHIARYTYAMPGTSEDRMAFERLINLLLVLVRAGDVAQALKQVNLTYATEYGVTADGRNRVSAWINGG